MTDNPDHDQSPQLGTTTEGSGGDEQPDAPVQAAEAMVEAPPIERLLEREVNAPPAEVTPPEASDEPASAAPASQHTPDDAEAIEIPIHTAAQSSAAAEVEAVARHLEEVEVQIRALPEPTPGRDAAAGVLRMVRENLQAQALRAAEETMLALRKAGIQSDYLDPDFWRGIAMVLQYQFDEMRAFIERRLKGQYEVDPYGLDLEIAEVVRPVLSFLYRNWWRVTPEGLEHVPAQGRALLVANHSGVLPFDGAMIGMSILEDHPQASGRILRNLYLSWFATIPFLAPLLTRLGQIQALPENAIRLLEEDQLVCVFPEGLKGVGKLFRDRYRLARFGRGGFVQAALRTGAPLLPVAVVGAEEIYPMLANAEGFARLIGFPYFPITPFFPWLGLLGVIPLPTRWNITFCEPIPTAQYGPDAADDPLIVFMLTELCRSRIQQTLDRKLAERKSVF